MIDISKFSLVTTNREKAPNDNGSLPTVSWSIFRKEENKEVDSLSRPYALEHGASKGEVRRRMVAKLIAGGWTPQQVMGFLDKFKNQTALD